MPKRRTEDVVHVVMTDHRIQRRPPSGDILAPLAEKADAEPLYRGPVVLYFPFPDPQRDLYLGIAQVKHQANLAEGIPLLESALRRLKPRSPEPWFELAEAQAAAGRREVAIASYRRCLEIDPGFVQAYNNLANLLPPREAMDHYRRALALDPGSAATHNNLGLVLLQLQDLPAAEASFRAALHANPDYAEAHLNLGSLLILLRRPDEARASIVTALTLNPDLEKARSNLRLLPNP